MKTLRNEDLSKAAMRGESVTVCGLSVYPITVYDYEDFCVCRDAVELRMSTLPARFAIQNYANALFDMTQSGENALQKSYFSKFIKLLALSLRMDKENSETDLYHNIFVKRESDKTSLAYILVQNGNESVTIEPQDFTAFRKVIAALNGLTLPDESDNADLIEDAKLKAEIQARDGVQLDVNIPDLIASVAYASRVREKEILEWTVKEFESRRKAIDRDKRFTLYAGAELSGNVTFKNGNPYPSWCFDAVDETLGTMETAKIQKALGG